MQSLNYFSRYSSILKRHCMWIINPIFRTSSRRWWTWWRGSRGRPSSSSRGSGRRWSPNQIKGKNEYNFLLYALNPGSEYTLIDEVRYNVQCAPKYMDRIFTTISTNYINWFIMAIKWKEIAWICLLAIEFFMSSEFNNLIPAVNCIVKGSLNILSKNIFCRIFFWNTILNWYFVTIRTKFVIAILICKLFKSTVIWNTPYMYNKGIH